MKKRTKISIYTALSLLLTSCSLDEIQQFHSRGENVIYASMESISTKAGLDSDLHVLWSEGDNIMTLPSGSLYEYSGMSEDGRGIFKRMISYAPDDFSRDSVAVYGVDGTWNPMRKDGVYITWDSVQGYCENSFGRDANRMIAIRKEGSNDDYVFRNLGGYLVVRLYGDEEVESVKLTAWDDHVISGPSFMMNGRNGQKKNTFDCTSFEGYDTSITVLAEEPVQLGHDEDSATEFWFVMAPQNFDRGFTVTVTSEMKRTVSFSSSEFRKIERNVVHKMNPVKVEFSKEPVLIVPEDTYHISADVQEVGVNVYADVDFSVSVPAECSWIKAWTYDPVGHVVTFSLEKNEGHTHRDASVSFVSMDGKMSSTISITQFPEDAIVDIIEPIHLTSHSWSYEASILCDGYVHYWIEDTTDGMNGSFIHVSQDGYKMSFDLSSSFYDEYGLKERSTNVELTCGDKKQTVTVILDGNEEELAAEKEELKRLYLALNGDAWTHNDNWCSDKPLCEWYGLVTDRFGRVSRISLNNNNVSGSIPNFTLEHLVELALTGNDLGGNLPSSLDKGYRLSLGFNNFTGDIPEELSDVILEGKLTLGGNRLDGKIPAKITSDPRWHESVWKDLIYAGNDYCLDKIEDIRPILSSTVDIYGEPVDVKKIVGENEYTCFYLWLTTCMWTEFYMPYLNSIYDNYHDCGFEIVGISPELGFPLYNPTDAEIREYAERVGMPWHTLRNNHFLDDVSPYISPTVIVLDKSGKMVFCSNLENDDRNALDAFISNRMEKPDLYESKDYSRDGEVKSLVGDRDAKLDLVIVGDGFADVDIENGTFGRYAHKAMSAFFEEAPLADHQEWFNVWLVNAVSKNNVYTKGSDTCFSVEFGEGTEIRGDDAKVLNYASKACTLDNTTIIVLVNSTKYAGTCYMYTSPESSGFAKGVSIAYVPIQDAAHSYLLGNEFRKTVIHEAAGHGFGRLGDEYWYRDSPSATSADKASLASYHSLGMYLNVDGNNDPAKVRWGKFLSDSRYSSEGLGIFEGGWVFRYGIYRPTEQSIMNESIGGFNAPSREAIYTRLNKLYYGDSWQYDYDEFVKSDEAARNRVRINTANSVPKALRKPFVPLAPPVLIMNEQ